MLGNIRTCTLLGRGQARQSIILTPFRMIEATAAPPHWKTVYSNARSRDILLEKARPNFLKQSD